MPTFRRPAVIAAAVSLMIAALGLCESAGSQPDPGWVPRVGDAVLYPWGEDDLSWVVASIRRSNGGVYLTLRRGDDEVLTSPAGVRRPSPIFGL